MVGEYRLEFSYLKNYCDFSLLTKMNTAYIDEFFPLDSECERGF